MIFFSGITHVHGNNKSPSHFDGLTTTFRSGWNHMADANM